MHSSQWMALCVPVVPLFMCFLGQSDTENVIGKHNLIHNIRCEASANSHQTKVNESVSVSIRMSQLFLNDLYSEKII